MEHKRVGRRSKGDRDRHTVRLPKTLTQAAKDQASASGLTLNDFIGHLLADKTGVPYDQQEGLKIPA